MGTRSLVIVKEGDLNSNDIMVIYRQYDGYPAGMGLDLFDKFGNHTVVNGFNSHTAENFANGMHCLSAQIVWHLKGGEIGNVYLYPAGTRDYDEEYIYIIYLKNDELHLQVEDVWGKKIIFNQRFSEFFVPEEVE